MNDADIIKSRFSFSLPADYMRCLGAGLLANDRLTGFEVSRYAWLSPDKIAGCVLPSYKITTLVPCAKTGGGDYYCWFVEAAGEAWIAECLRDSNFAEGFAPNFEGFVFRSLLEEFADTWLTTDLGQAAEIFREYAVRSRRVLRTGWAEILVSLAANNPRLNRVEHPQVVSEREVSEIIKSHLAFPSLGKEFRQNVE